MFHENAIARYEMARRVIAQLLSYELTEYWPEEYRSALIGAVREIAIRANSTFEALDVGRFAGQSKYEYEQNCRILQNSDPAFRARSDYLGDKVTLSDLHTLATECYSISNTDFTFTDTAEGRFATCTLGDLHGPVKCDKCKRMTSMIYITPEEYALLPYKKGSAGFLRYVMLHHVGEALCARDAPKLTT